MNLAKEFSYGKNQYNPIITCINNRFNNDWLRIFDLS